MIITELSILSTSQEHVGEQITFSPSVLVRHEQKNAESPCSKIISIAWKTSKPQKDTE